MEAILKQILGFAIVSGFITTFGMVLANEFSFSETDIVNYIWVGMGVFIATGILGVGLTLIAGKL